ncbi:DUF6221 family protein [Kineosporia babensis]|uniref:DUF6221 family protein n=1 Tax=Kineosporia babensis TaxID=499548 RepID=A0A9X1ND39_9ACTN|nr:DUF6221 family protein [Kineosporia babensis]MCD5310818.1 DUF6221 family protein [Kineosporia babensis]
MSPDRWSRANELADWMQVQIAVDRLAVEQAQDPERALAEWASKRTILGLCHQTLDMFENSNGSALYRENCDSQLQALRFVVAAMALPYKKTREGWREEWVL